MYRFAEKLPFKIAMTVGAVGALLAVISLGVLVTLDFNPAKYSFLAGVAATIGMVGVIVFYLIRDMWRGG